MDLKNLDCPALKKLPLSDDVMCNNHPIDFNNYICAVKNSYKLKSWLEENKKTLDIDEGDCGCNHSFEFTVPSLFFIK